MINYKSPSIDVLSRAALSCIIAACVVAALAFGKEILIPLVLAVLLSFVLSPLVNGVQRAHVPLVPSVVLVVLVVLGIVCALGFALAHQVVQLGDELPKYETTVRQKLKLFRSDASSSGILNKANDALRELSRELDQPSPKTPDVAASGTQQSAPIPVEIHQPPNRPLEIYQRIVSSLLGPVSTTAIVLVIVVFILLQRTDIRDRVIRLAGTGDIQLTTAALNDAASRLSRLFLAQTALNATFGVLIALGLWAIGIPSPALWGVLSGLMRFVPYIGAPISALFPILLGVAVGQGFSMAVETAAMFLALELVIGNFIEPWVQGHTTGLSPLAIVVSAILWTSLWGPIGLLIATPVTMCLVVLGRHIDGLSFLGVILGDEPALQPPEVFYQRLLSRSPADISEQVEEFLEKGTLLDYYDTVALPGILLAAQDAERGAIDDAKMVDIREGIEFVVDDLDDVIAEHKTGNDDQKTEGPEARHARKIEPADLKSAFTKEIPAILCIGARTPIDTAAASMMAHVLTQDGLGARTQTLTRLTDINTIDLSGIQLVWITATSMSLAHAHIRYIVRRLRRNPTEIVICGAFWQTERHSDEAPIAGIKHLADSYSAVVERTMKLASKPKKSVTEQINAGVS